MNLSHSTLTSISIHLFFILLVFLGPIKPGLAINNLMEAADTSQSEKTAKNAEISNQTDSLEDQRIKKRLKEIFSNIDGLDKINVSVESGIVELSGKVLTAEAQKKAEELAQRVKGVIEVNDNIELDSAVEKRVSILIERIHQSFLTVVSYIPLVIIALLIMVLSWFFGGLVTRSNIIFKKIAPNQFIADLFKQLLRFGFLIVGVLLGLEILDASSLITSIFGVAGLVGLAIGFAIKDTVENYITSILLSLRQPFAPNDYVSIEGIEGFVVRLTARATIIRSPDGNDVRIPNASVYKSTIVNYTHNPLRRFSFNIRISSQQDIPSAQQLAIDTISKMDGVAADFPCLCLVDELSNASVSLIIYGWVNQNTADFGKVRSGAIWLVKKIFDEANVIMSETTYHIKLAKQIPIDKESVIEPQVNSGEEFIDIKPNQHIEQQLNNERRQINEPNLLDEDAPKE